MEYERRMLLKKADNDWLFFKQLFSIKKLNYDLTIN